MNRMARIAVIAAMVTTPALGQEPIVLLTTGAAALPVHDDPAFDWTGFYAGVYGAVASDPVNGTQLGAGLNLGYNRAFDFVLVGGEVAFHPLGNDLVASSYLQAVGRGGVLVTDNVLLFGSAGFGIDTNPASGDHVLAGAGLEVGVTDNVSLRGQYLHGFPVNNTAPIEQVTFGAEFHF